MLFGLMSNLTFSSYNFVSHSIQGMRHHRNVVHWWIFLVRKEDKPRITYCWLLNFYFTSLFFWLFKKMSSWPVGWILLISYCQPAKQVSKSRNSLLLKKYSTFFKNETNLPSIIAHKMLRNIFDRKPSKLFVCRWRCECDEHNFNKNRQGLHFRKLEFLGIGIYILKQ